MSFYLYNTITNYLNVHLTVKASLRVPPLLAYNVSNFGVILLLFYLDPCLFSFLPPSRLTYSFTLFIQLRRYCEIGEKPSGGYDFKSHFLKIVSNISIFMRSRNIYNIAQLFYNHMGNLEVTILVILPLY